METVNSLGPHRMYVGTINLLLVRSTDAKELAFFILYFISCLHYCARAPVYTILLGDLLTGIKRL